MRRKKIAFLHYDKRRDFLFLQVIKTISRTTIQGRSCGRTPALILRNKNAVHMTIADVSSLTNAPEPFDLCIVGGGAVGLTLAADLAATGLRLLVLEGGRRKRSSTGQELYRGEVVDPARHSPLHQFRIRALGGSSQIWGGRCTPYDPIDFDVRAWVPHSGWPIPHEALYPYYARASAAAETGAFDYDPHRPLVPGLESKWLETTLERFSRPTDFSERYGEDLRRAHNALVLLNATVTGIRLRPGGRTVAHLDIAAPDGSSLQVRAGAYVLAAGGLETTRLLLASDDVHHDGIGNAGGWLGRGYMCHLSANFGSVKFFSAPSAVGWNYEKDGDGVFVRRRLSLTPQAQRHFAMLNLTFRLQVHDIANPAHGDPILSLWYLARHFMRYTDRKRLWDAQLRPAQRRRHLRNLFRRPIYMASTLLRLARERNFTSRPVPSLALFSRENCYGLEFHSEQAPNPDSRVTLSEARDRFGMRRLRVDWRWSPLDLDTVRKSYQLLAAELERTQVGRLTYDAAQLEAVTLGHGAFGGHHIGTARMAANPADGVVDRDCRVHGVDNLYLAGSAVFPTSSQANPTLTALALALRLADHLKEGSAGTVQPELKRETVLGNVT